MIEVFADISCAFTYVGLLKVIEERDTRRSDQPIHVKAWPLELVNGAPLSGALVAEKVEALRTGVAPDLFVGFDAAAVPATTLPALALGAAGYRHSLELGERVSVALRRALFEEGLDVAEPVVLDRIATAHGIDRATADVGPVHAEWHEGQRRGVEGSPTFFVHGQRFFCPALDIRRERGRLTIEQDELGLEQFLGVALGSPATGSQLGNN